MTGQAGDSRRGEDPGNPWERRAASMAGEFQRWLIRASARNLRDEFTDQVRQAMRGHEADPADIWDRATTEPPSAAADPPECAWCPICRAARMAAEARRNAGARPGADAGSGGSQIGAVVTEATDVAITAVREVLSGLDSLLSYRPPTAPPSGQAGAGPADAGQAGGTGKEDGGADEPAKGREREPDDRG